MSFQDICAPTAATRRHNRRVLWASVVYALTLIPIVYVIRHGLVAGPGRMALAVVPALPLAAMFASYARYLSEETDEYIRMVVVRQILAATTVAMVCAVIWGFLTDLGGAPPIATYWIALIWFVTQGVIAIFQKVRG